MPLALLLSPDDQAVSAVTSVLEEMSVTCERPLDGVTAAKKLHSNNFDLVVVDCDNLPAAKLIFDVCRRGKGSNNPVPVAIVDGRAGLPTAFRLGAELILTKPVAKDQARNTIRTAINRMKKEVAPRAGQTDQTAVKPAEETATEASGVSADSKEALLTHYESGAEAPETTAAAETLAMAAAASGQGQAISEATTVAASEAPVAMMSAAAEAPAADMNAAASSEVMSAAAEAPAGESLATAEPDVAGEAKTTTDAEEAKAAPMLKAVDESVREEVEKTEAQPMAASAAGASPEKERGTHTKKESTKNDSPMQRWTRGVFAAAVVLVLVGGGLYAAWLTQPAFRTLVEPQVDNVLAMVGMTGTQTPPPAPIARKLPAPPMSDAAGTANGADSLQSSAQPAVDGPAGSTSAAAAAGSTQTTAATGNPTAAGQNATASTSGQPAGANATPATAGTGAAAATVSGTASNKTNSDKTSGDKTNGDKSGANQTSGLKSADSKAASRTVSTAEGAEKSAVLSSKEAEQRLTHSVQPSYPASAQGTDLKSTVVLSATVDENGKVTAAHITQGNSALAEAAVSAVKQWRYRPYVRDGKALPFQTVVQVDFQKP